MGFKNPATTRTDRQSSVLSHNNTKNDIVDDDLSDD